MNFMKRIWQAWNDRITEDTGMDTDADGIDKIDNVIEYKGFVRRVSDTHSMPAVLVIYPNGLRVVREDCEYHIENGPYYIVDKDQPKGKYMCENGAREFFPSQEIE